MSPAGSSSEPPGPTMRAAIGPGHERDEGDRPGRRGGEREQRDGGDDEHERGCAGRRRRGRRGSRRRAAASSSARPCASSSGHAHRARDRERQHDVPGRAVEAAGEPLHRGLQVPRRGLRQHVGHDAVEHRGDADADEDEARRRRSRRGATAGRSPPWSAGRRRARAARRPLSSRDEHDDAEHGRGARPRADADDVGRGERVAQHGLERHAGDAEGEAGEQARAPRAGAAARRR